MKDFLREHWFKIGILTVLLITGLLFYDRYVSISQTQLDIEKQKLLDQESKLSEEQAQKENTASLLQDCLNAADIEYGRNWNANCKLEGKGENCTSLLLYHADEVNKILKDEKDNCFRQYPQK